MARSTSRGLLTAVAIVAVAGSLHAGQAMPAPGGEWSSKRFSIEPLSIAITARGAGCQAGIVAGFADNKVFAVTAATQYVSSPSGFNAVPITRVRGIYVTGGPRIYEWIDASTARIVRQDSRFVVIEIDDPAMARWAASLKFDVLGDATTLVRQDSVYVVGCQLGMPGNPELTSLSDVVDRVLVFQGYSAFRPDLIGGDPLVGGAVVQAFGSFPLMVGMASTNGPRTQASSIQDVVDQLEMWAVPTLLTAPGTRVDCRYRYTLPDASVSARLPFRSDAGQRAVISVQTGASCPWTAFADGAPWIRVSSNASGPGPVQERIGSGTVTVETTQQNACGASVRRSAVFVAGHRIHIEQASCP